MIHSRQTPGGRGGKPPHERGFTLVEIMVVVVIVGLLATVVMTNVFGNIEQGKLSKTKHDLSTIAQAAEMYKLHHGNYPEEIAQLVEENEAGRQYLNTPEVPVDPWNDQEYRLERQGAKMVVICDGHDGQPDTDDDITTKNMHKLKLDQYLTIINQNRQ